MYITRLVLQNFQSHVETDLTFARGLNAVFGESERGKTAIWRAVRWVLYNLPEHGQPFIRAGADRCRVSVSFSNGFTITRECTTRGDSYTISRPEAAAILAAKYPLDLLRREGLRYVELPDGGEVVLNLLSQADALLRLPAAMRAELFRRVGGRWIIEAAAAEAERALARVGEAGGGFVSPYPLPSAALTPRELLEQVVMLLREAASFAANEEKRQVERVVTYVLQYVFGEAYQFRIQPTPDGQGIKFAVVSDCGGSRIEHDPVDAFGGGLTDVVALALRLVLLEISWPPIRGPLMLDEPARNVSDAYINGVARLLRTLADVFERQIIVTTSNQHLVGTADTLHILQLEDGASKVHRR